MSNYETTISLIRSIAGQSAIISIPRVFIQLTGDIKAALLLSQCVFWSDKGDREDGFVYKTMEEWRNETGLTKNELYTARDKVAGLVEFKVMKANGAPTLHFRVNMEAIANAITDFLENGKSINLKIENPNTGQSLTDIKAVNDNQSRKKESSQSEKPKKQAKPKPAPTPKEVIDPVIDALSEVTGMDKILNIGQLGREAKAFIRAGITPEELRRYYGQNGIWYRSDWRGQKGQRPDPAAIRKTIAGYRKSYVAPPVEIDDDYAPDTGDDTDKPEAQPQPKREPDYWQRLVELVFQGKPPRDKIGRAVEGARYAGITPDGTMEVIAACDEDRLLLEGRVLPYARQYAHLLNGGSIARVAFVGEEG